MPLGPGVGNSSVKAALEALDLEQAFAPHHISDRTIAEGCRSAVWLYHDYLDTSHTISQGITTETGSYWHAIMHRREPDYPNSKYWFGRAGDHSVFPAIREAAAGIAATATSLPDSATFLTTQSAWDPYAFVDLCKAANFGRTPVGRRTLAATTRSLAITLEPDPQEGNGDVPSGTLRITWGEVEYFTKWRMLWP